MIDPDMVRLLLDGGFGAIALVLLHQVAGRLGSLEATLSLLARRIVGGRDDEG